MENSSNFKCLPCQEVDQEGGGGGIKVFVWLFQWLTKFHMQMFQRQVSSNMKANCLFPLNITLYCTLSSNPSLLPSVMVFIPSLAATVKANAVCSFDVSDKYQREMLICSLAQDNSKLTCKGRLKHSQQNRKHLRHYLLTGRQGNDYL